MTEIEKAVPMHVRLGNMEVGPNQGYKKGVEEPIDEFEEHFLAFTEVGWCQLSGCVLTR